MTHRIFVFALTSIVVFSGIGSAQEKPAKQGAGASTAPFPHDPKEALAAARWLEKTYTGSKQPESVRMLIAIANGSRMGPGEGWFGPCHTRYTWDWLARHHGVAPGGISAKEFRGPADLFARLDRNRDGRISADDLDWSERSTYLQQAALVNHLFAPINAKRDGKITRDEMLAFFDKASKGKGHITPEDLHDIMFPSTPRTFMPGDGPTQEILIRGLFAGELGSLQDGPALDRTAPDFTLKTADGKQTIRFSSLQGPRPIVLVFGNLTCGPFRRTAVAVEALHRRYKDRATFVGVYVREAHPTDGWAMASNKRAGFVVKQPRTYEERAKVCTQFCEAIRPTMPFLVDEINDPVGNAYSGMPGRLYVIDPKGKVAYKSGRGPFGFKVGEFEQAIVMSLLEFPPAAKKVAEKAVDPTGAKKR